MHILNSVKSDNDEVENQAPAMESIDQSAYHKIDTAIILQFKPEHNAKKLAEAKRRVYEAAKKLTW